MRRVIFFYIFAVAIIGANAQCSEEVIAKAEAKVKKYISGLNIQVDERHTNGCATRMKVSDIPLQQFLILTSYFEYSRLYDKNMRSLFLEVTDNQGTHIACRTFGGYDLPTTIQGLKDRISLKKAYLEGLKQDQRKLTLENIDLLGTILVAEIPSTKYVELTTVVQDAANKLKKQGIESLAEYYGVKKYEPMYNYNKQAIFYENIFKPIDMVLSEAKIPSSFLFYYECFKHVANVGNIVGNTGGKLWIYFQQADLENEIRMLEQRLKEKQSCDVQKH